MPIKEAPQVECGRDGRTLNSFDHLVTYTVYVAIGTNDERGAASDVHTAEVDLTA
jgi:hypothetical protein